MNPTSRPTLSEQLAEAQRRVSHLEFVHNCDQQELIALRLWNEAARHCLTSWLLYCDSCKAGEQLIVQGLRSSEEVGFELHATLQVLITTTEELFRDGPRTT